MNLINSISLKFDYKEYKRERSVSKASSKKHIGYSIYESLEFSKDKQRQNKLDSQIETIISYLR